MNWRSNISVVLACFVSLGIISCRTQQNADIRIGVAQFIDQPALDQTRAGFMQEMGRLGMSTPKVTFEYQNAQGSMSDAAVIADRFAQGKYDLVFSLATPMTQVMKRAMVGRSTPIIFGAITDPVSAGLVSSMSHPGGGITGTSDRWPYEEQMKLIRILLPKADTVCVVFNPGEDNSKYAMEQTRPAASAYHLKLIESAVSVTADVYAAADAIAGRCSAFYVPADNIAMASAQTIVRVANLHNIPVFAGDPETFKAGCVAGLGVSYYDLGVQAAQIARRVLVEHIPAGDIPVVTSQAPLLMIDKQVAKRFNIAIPDNLSELLKGQ
jgi:putative ABC transport system substrate-binding protein